MEKRTQKGQRKQHAWAEAVANKQAEQAEMEKALLAYVMLQQIAVIARSDTLGAGATEEEAHATGETTFAIARAGK